VMDPRRTILIVDDDHSLVQLVGGILRKEGFDILTAFDGLEGLQKAREEQPDLVILDLVMPKLNGFQALEQLRMSSNVPVIILTTECAVTTSRNALALGADDYIRKPFSARELAARVRAKLRRTRNEVP
jgi:two-component system response regulator VicR